jgi:hypothetical protein
MIIKLTRYLICLSKILRRIREKRQAIGACSRASSSGCYVLKIKIVLENIAINLES